MGSNSWTTSQSVSAPLRGQLLPQKGKNDPTNQTRYVTSRTHPAHRNATTATSQRRCSQHTISRVIVWWCYSCSMPIVWSHNCIMQPYINASMHLLGLSPMTHLTHL